MVLRGSWVGRHHRGGHHRAWLCSRSVCPYARGLPRQHRPPEGGVSDCTTRRAVSTQLVGNPVCAHYRRHVTPGVCRRGGTFRRGLPRPEPSRVGHSRAPAVGTPGTGRRHSTASTDVRVRGKSGPLPPRCAPVVGGLGVPLDPRAPHRCTLRRVKLIKQDSQGRHDLARHATSSTRLLGTLLSDLSLSRALVRYLPRDRANLTRKRPRTRRQGALAWLVDRATARPRRSVRPEQAAA
eukprot:7231680-Prymnesium_polylepis.1